MKGQSVKQNKKHIGSYFGIVYRYSLRGMFCLAILFVCMFGCFVFRLWTGTSVNRTKRTRGHVTYVKEAKAANHGAAIR